MEFEIDRELPERLLRQIDAGSVYKVDYSVVTALRALIETQDLAEALLTNSYGVTFDSDRTAIYHWTGRDGEEREMRRKAT